MRTIAFGLAAVALASLAGCGGGQSQSESTAENLEEAAAQSTPEAADVLENAADQIRDQNVQDPAAGQQALDAAGNAQVNAGTAQSNGTE
jgi:hypothetical protein